MGKTNFEKWTESPSALLEATKGINRYAALIEMGIIDFEAWAASESHTPVWADPRPATYHDKPHKTERPCTLLDTSPRRWGTQYAIIYDDESEKVLQVPMRNVTVTKDADSETE